MKRRNIILFLSLFCILFTMNSLSLEKAGGNIPYAELKLIARYAKGYKYVLFNEPNDANVKNFLGTKSTEIFRSNIVEREHLFCIYSGEKLLIQRGVVSKLPARALSYDPVRCPFITTHFTLIDFSLSTKEIKDAFIAIDDFWDRDCDSSKSVCVDKPQRRHDQIAEIKRANADDLSPKIFVVLPREGPEFFLRRSPNGFVAVGYEK